jgi:hypothetical protein
MLQGLTWFIAGFDMFVAGFHDYMLAYIIFVCMVVIYMVDVHGYCAWYGGSLMHGQVQGSS